MRNIFFAAVVLATTVVNAAEITVLEANLPHIGNGRSEVDTRFHMNLNTDQGYVKVSVYEERFVNNGPYGGGYPGPDRFPTPMPMPMPMPEYIPVFDNTVRVEGLMLVGKKIIFQGPEGEVECGTMGKSRILRRTTINLSGNCKLSGRVIGNFENSKVIVTLKTK